MSENTQFDVIVVGSGMSGGYAAKEFCEKGYKTLVIERGKENERGTGYIGEGLQPWDMEFRDRVNPKLSKSDYDVQSTCYAFRESTRHYFINDKENPYSHEEGKPFAWIRGDQVGGKSLMWARQSYRWSELDFEANKNDGYGTDWPIRYSDVEPWYDYVERFVGISGSYENLPQLPDSVFQPPMEMTCVEKAAKERIEAAYDERKVIIGRAAHLTEPTQEQMDLGRGACQFRNQCERGCSFGGYFSSVSATIPAAQRTGNYNQVTDSIVEKLIYDPETKKVTGVQTIDRNTGERVTYKSRVVFLCASTLGSVQIMLNSASEAFPNGFANTSGVLGQYLMDHHHRVGARGRMPGFDDRYFIGRRPNGIYVPRFRNVEGQETEYLRGFGFQGSGYRSSWTRALQGRGYGKDLKQELRDPSGWYFYLGGFGEMLPRASNQVRLHPSKTDKFGIPQIHVDMEWSENEAIMREDIRKTAEEMLIAAGCTDISTYNNEATPGHAIHEMGGARMGRDPSTSILNAYNQCHDVDNVFVTDGSAFASESCVNPSLTFMALTARAADYADQQMKENRI